MYVLAGWSARTADWHHPLRFCASAGMATGGALRMNCVAVLLAAPLPLLNCTTILSYILHACRLCYVPARTACALSARTDSALFQSHVLSTPTAEAHDARAAWHACAASATYASYADWTCLLVDYIPRSIYLFEQGLGPLSRSLLGSILIKYSSSIVRFIKNVPFGDLPWEISGCEGL